MQNSIYSTSTIMGVVFNVVQHSHKITSTYSIVNKEVFQYIDIKFIEMFIMLLILKHLFGWSGTGMTHTETHQQ